MSPVCDCASQSTDSQSSDDERWRANKKGDQPPASSSRLPTTTFFGEPTHASKSLEEGSPKPETCFDAWSGCSFAPWVIGNMFFVCYCVFVIPKLLGPNRLVVYALAGYISFLGLSQLTECLLTGQGTNYGKFAGTTDVQQEKSCYAKLMDKLSAPAVPICISWWTMEQPAFITALCFLVFTLRTGAIAAHSGFVFLVIFMTHYFQRSFIYPCLTRGKSYPALYWFLALVFCSVNGTLQSLDLLYGGHFEGDDFAAAMSPRAIIGVFVFIFGMFTNIHSDYILRNLRKPGEMGYKIPKGGMFRFISGANLWGEVVEWLGFAIAAGTLGSIVFSVFCFVGIGARCIATHEWYLKKFPNNYPSLGRKRMIPLVW